MQIRGVRNLRTILSIALLGLLSIQPGCGAPDPMSPESADEARLRDVGELYRVHQALQNKPPKVLKDLALEANGSPSGFEVIKNGEVIVQWGATLPDTKEEPGSGSSPEVLAYLKKVPEEGGLVLMLDRSIRKMTAEEFRSAPKAGGAEPRKGSN